MGSGEEARERFMIRYKVFFRLHKSSAEVSKLETESCFY